MHYMYSKGWYIDTILTCFNMSDCYLLGTPLKSTSNLFTPVTNDNRKIMKNKPYAQLIGSLMYAAIGTRPDIMFAVLMLARFMFDPSVNH